LHELGHDIEDEAAWPWEEDVATIKTTISLLFRSLLDRTLRQPSDPSSIAFLTKRILESIPTSVFDRTESTYYSRVPGKELFRQHILEAAQFYLQVTPPPIGERALFERSNGPFRITLLSDSEKLRLVQFIGRLVDDKVLPFHVIRDYVELLLTSTAVRTPTRSDLAAVGCLIETTSGEIISWQTWLTKLYSAIKSLAEQDIQLRSEYLRLRLIVSVYARLTFANGSHLW
jgi:hypothetical protein